MTTIVSALFAVVLALQEPGVARAVDDLTRVRELYALASYEEALARLDAAQSRIAPERAAEYRALCLLGLNRAAEAAEIIDQLVLARPTYAMVEADVPPRLYALYRDARQRAVPAAARAQYAAARAAFDAGAYSQAADEFRAVLALLNDDAVVAAGDGLRDLRTLSDGFLGLAEVEVRRRELTERQPPTAEPLAASTPPPAPRAAVAAAPAAPVAPALEATPNGNDGGPPMATPDITYSESDALVTPPVEVSRRLPAWNPAPALARMQFRGVLEVVIDRTGAVAAASLVTPVHPTYDTALVDAARRWRFQPATLNGEPVVYRKTFEIVLNRR